MDADDKASKLVPTISSPSEKPLRVLREVAGTGIAKVGDRIPSRFEQQYPARLNSMSPSASDNEIEKQHQLLSDILLEVLRLISNSLNEMKSWDPIGSHRLAINAAIDETQQAILRAQSHFSSDVRPSQSAVAYSRFSTELDLLSNVLAGLKKRLETTSSQTTRSQTLHSLPRPLRTPSTQSLLDINTSLRLLTTSLELLQASMQITATLTIELEQMESERTHMQKRITGPTETKVSRYSPPFRYIEQQDPPSKSERHQYHNHTRLTASKELIQQVKETILSIDQRPDFFSDFSLSDSNLKRHVYFRGERLRGTCDWFIQSQWFRDGWLSGDHRALVCLGGPGVGKSTIASRVIDELADLDYAHAFYYLGNCGVNSAEMLTLSLLSQLHGLELKNEIPDIDPLSTENDDQFPSMIGRANVGVVTEAALQLPNGGACYAVTPKDIGMAAEISPVIDALDERLIDIGLNRSVDHAAPSLVCAKPRRSFQILLEILVNALSRADKAIYIVLDGWEEERMEPESRSDFYAVLDKLHTAGCWLFLTRRTESRDLIPFECTVISVEDYRPGEEIEKFTRFRVQDVFKIRRYHPGNSKTMDWICRKASEISKGSFTLVTLFVNNLRIAAKPSTLRSYLRGPLNYARPGQLMTAHISRLCKCEEPVSIYIVSTLLWMAFAIAPAPIDHFRAPLQWVSDELQKYRQDHILQNDEDITMHAILARLEGLVVLDHGNGLMQLDSEVREIVKSLCFSEKESTAMTSSISGKIILGCICLYCIEYIFDVKMEYTCMKSRKDASELLHKYPFLSHAVRCWGTYCREFDSRMIDGQQSQEKRLPLTYKGKVLEIHDGEARYYYEVTEPIEEIAQHNTQLNSEEESLGAEGPAEELQKQLQALASLSFKVSTRTSELIEDRAKISMAVLLATYLSPDSSTSHLSWITLSSWVTSMSDLAIASRLGLNREVTQRSLGRDENCLNFQDSRGNTPLHEAVKAGFEDVVRTLLDAGASVSVMNLSSMTPVEYAMDYRRTRIFLIIFEYMYSINAGPRDEDGKLATYYCSCVAGDQIDTGRLLALGLFHAVKIPNSEIVRKLLKTGADPDAFDNENIPVLHHAIRSSAQAENRSGDRRCPAELLYSGADPTIQSRDGKNESALHVAIRYGDLLSAKRLLRYGADPNSTDAKGRPPIFALFDSEAEYSDDGYSEIISELAGWGADLDQPDYKHDRALHLAAQRRLPYVIQLLIWMGADCNQKDEDGMRPLEYAQRMKDEESITILTSFTNGSTRPGKK